MTTAGQGTDSAAATPGDTRGGTAPAPGGTALLAGRAVARVGFGAMQLEHRAADRAAALAILRQAVGAGVNHIDTAQFYDGCNALIRDALSPYPDDLVLVTKVGADRDDSGKLIPGQRPEQLPRADRGQPGRARRRQASTWSTCAGWTPPPASSRRGISWSTSTTSSRSYPRCGTRGKIGWAGPQQRLRPANFRARRSPWASRACRTLYSVIDRTAEPVLDLCREARHAPGFRSSRSARRCQTFGPG